MQDRSEDAAGSAARPFVSVVIPTRGRPELLARCLQFLLRQDYPSDRLEIVVVEDGGTGSAEMVLADVRPACPQIDLRYVRIPPSGPAAARNRGWRLARGAIIAFTDDDTLPERRWLAEGVRPFAKGAGAVSGQTRVPLPRRPTDYQRNVRGLERAPFATCNALCRRELLEAVGGFDERFTRAYREDSDLQFALLDAGARIVRHEAAVVHHPAPPGPPFVSLRLQRNQFFDALLYRKHPERFRTYISRHPPWRHYLITAAQLSSVLAAFSGRRRIAVLSGAVWLALVAQFFARRVRGALPTLGHVAEMGITSVLIPPVAVYWRLRGAWAFRVHFL